MRAIGRGGAPRGLQLGLGGQSPLACTTFPFLPGKRGAKPPAKEISMEETEGLSRWKGWGFQEDTRSSHFRAVIFKLFDHDLQ